jgi:hypothetical protein
MRHVMAASALLVALVGCGSTADPLPEGSTDFPTTQPEATAEPDRAACREAIKDEAFADALDAENPPTACEGFRPDELVAIADEAIAELEALAGPDTGTPAAASTCDVAREAFLTGTEAEIEAALEALVADRDADATAREAAQSYLEESDPTLRRLHKDLVQVLCTTVP